MNDLFAWIYETVFKIFNFQFALIFDTLFDNGGYNLLGLSFIFVPLILSAAFYFVWKYPYGKFWHWLVWLVVASLVAAGISWGISSNEIFMSDNQELIDALADPGSGYQDYANTLPAKYALLNGFLALILGFLYSLVLKQFSKIQIHLPF